jgi:hypothetical protein
MTLCAPLTGHSAGTPVLSRADLIRCLSGPRRGSTGLEFINYFAGAKVAARGQAPLALFGTVTGIGFWRQVPLEKQFLGLITISGPHRNPTVFFAFRKPGAPLSVVHGAQLVSSVLAAVAVIVAWRLPRHSTQSRDSGGRDVPCHAACLGLRDICRGLARGARGVRIGFLPRERMAVCR